MVSHCDDDDLSLLALGESVDPDVEAHLATCSRCQSRSRRARTPSMGAKLQASRQAAPSPAASSALSVPERWPPSWPLRPITIW